MSSLIGIMGGTFDPVHRGHLEPAKAVMDTLSMQQVRFIPNKIPPHRSQPWLGEDQRLRLLHSAVEDYPGFVVDERELRREGKSFMVDTLESLRTDFLDDRLCLIIGMDAMLDLHQWHRWRDIFNLCHIIVTERPGFRWKDNIESDKEVRDRVTDDVQRLYTQASGVILIQSVPQIDISASQIREDLADGKDISHWVPKKTLRLLLDITENSKDWSSG